MTSIEKTEKIMAAINSRGWFALGIYSEEAKELAAQGVIKWGERFSVGGNRVLVWVKA